MEPIPLDPVDSLSVTTLVDNTTDLLLADEGPATRAPLSFSAYPSGHAIRSVIVFGALLLLSRNRFLRAGLLVVLGGIAASRAYIGVHWSSDADALGECTGRPRAFVGVLGKI